MEIRPFIVRLIQGNGLRAADVRTSDPFVIVTSSLVAGSNVLSMTRSRHIDSTLDPVWNDDLLIAECNAYSHLRFIVCDHDTFGKSDFLGEGSVTLSDFPNLIFDGEPVHIQLPLGNFSGEPTGLPKPLKLGDTDEDGQGLLTLEIVPLPLAYGMCGDVHRLSQGRLFRGAEWHDRYCILSDSKISYYEDAFSLHEAKGEYNMSSVLSFREENVEGRDALVLEFPDDAKLHIHVADQESKNAWVRRLENTTRKHAQVGFAQGK